MQSTPKIEKRAELPYVGVRAVMSMSDFERRTPEMLAKVSDRLAKDGVTKAGQPFLRYWTIDMPERLDVELGVPIAGTAIAGEGVARGTLPPGRYATMQYTGVKNGVAANKTLIAWIGEQGELMLSHEAPNGEAFAARYETFVANVSDPDERITEIAIQLRD